MTSLTGLSVLCLLLIVWIVALLILLLRASANALKFRREGERWQTMYESLLATHTHDQEVLEYKAELLEQRLNMKDKQIRDAQFTVTETDYKVEALQLENENLRKMLAEPRNELSAVVYIGPNAWTMHPEAVRHQVETTLLTQLAEQIKPYITFEEEVKPFHHPTIRAYITVVAKEPNNNDEHHQA